MSPSQITAFKVCASVSCCRRALTLFSFLFFVALFQFGCSPEEKSAEISDIIVLQTGRLRGNVVPEGVKGSRSPQYYRFIAGYVKQVREKAALTNTPVLLLDLGDSLTGSFSASVTESENVVTFFNALKYDAIMLGNLDSDVTSDVVKKLSMPVLCPFASPDGQPILAGTKFATSLKKGPWNVQLLANFYGDTPSSENSPAFPVFFGGSSVVKPFRGYPALIKAMGKSDDNTLRIFEWLKFEYDLSGKDGSPEFFSDLKDWSVDLVAAHRVYSRSQTDTWIATSKNSWKPPVSLNTLRSNRGFALARADLKRSHGKWVMLRQQVLPMVSNTVPEDRAIAEALKPLAGKINKANRQIAYSEEGLNESGVLSRCLAALATVPGTTLAMYSPSSVRASWPQREIYLGDIYNSIPWARNQKSIVQFELTPEQLEKIRSWKEYAFLATQNAPSGQPWVVTTSFFSAVEVGRKLGLDADKFREVVDVPEYLFLTGHLQKTTDPGAAVGSTPQGWEELPAP